MTFEDFQIFCIDQQKAYIASERHRYAMARDMAIAHGHEPYEAQKWIFNTLNLWPHTITEIDTRFTELDSMEKRILEDFGDTPTMRFSYDCWLKSQA